MYESTFSTSRAMAYGGWAMVVILLALAWGIGLGVDRQWGYLIGYTACAGSAAAAVAHIRWIVQRACRFISAVVLEESRPGAEVRAMRR